MFGGGLILVSTAISLPSRRFGLDYVVQWSDLIGKLGSAMIFGTFLFYGAELFPTSVRPKGMGITQMVTKIGALTVPFVIQAGRHIWYLSYVIVIISLTLTVICSFLLPETAGYSLCHTTDDVAKMTTDKQRNMKLTLLISARTNTEHCESITESETFISSSV